MVFSEPKKLSDMTIDEAKRVLTDKNICGNCHDCLAHQLNWKNVDANSCREITKKALEIVFSRIEELEEDLLKEKQEGAPSIVFTLPYKQTIKFMKNKGYTHCYMCGASLYEKED